VCHASALNSTWLSFSTARQRQSPAPSGPQADRYCCFHQTDRTTREAGLTYAPTHGDKATEAGPHTLPPLAACGPPRGGVLAPELNASSFPGFDGVGRPGFDVTAHYGIDAGEMGARADLW
jgi:hypothetical protein